MSHADAPPMPQPTAEHKKLNEHVGNWEVDCTFYMDPSQPPMKTKAKETVKMFGNFFTTSHFECDMFGSPFQGSATLGYDPAIGKYVSTWIDSMSPSLFYLSGNFDKTGKTLSMTGEGPDCMGGGMANFRTSETHKDKDNRVFEMFMTPKGGKEVKLFTHVYKRKGK